MDAGDDDDDNEDDGDDDGSDDRDSGAVADAATRDGGTPRDAGTSDAGRDAGRDAGGGGATGCSALTYESFGKQFITDYCVSCHAGQTTGPLLDTLQAVVREKASVKNMVSTNSMPPRRNPNQPTATERQQFLQWIDCGPK